MTNPVLSTKKPYFILTQNAFLTLSDRLFGTYIMLVSQNELNIHHAVGPAKIMWVNRFIL